MPIFIRAYLRASTDEQDAQRARGAMDQFVGDKGLTVCTYYAENESGARLDRPALFRLMADSLPGDILLVEDVDRLSRLVSADWEKLKSLIRERQVRVVAVNVPTTWQHLSPAVHEFDQRMFSAINDMLLDMLAAIALRDYEQRRERQKQGIAKAKSAGKYRGRQIDQARYGAINRLLASGNSWSVVQRTVGCSRSTISKAARHGASAAVAVFAPAAPLAISEPSCQFIAVVLWFAVENNSKFTRGKARARQEIENLVASCFESQKRNDGEIRFVVAYSDDADLKEQLNGLIAEMHDTAELRNCGILDFTVTDEATGCHWCDYEGGWK